MKLGKHFDAQLEFSQSLQFRACLKGSLCSLDQLIYQGAPKKSVLSIDFKKVDEEAFRQAHIAGVQLYATLLAHMYPTIEDCDELHKTFSKLFPGIGVLESIEFCSFRTQINLDDYVAAYLEELSRVMNAKPNDFDVVTQLQTKMVIDMCLKIVVDHLHAGTG
ncbi:hypothetical protein [Roseibacillus persicicus]|uniref:hypothetical protein n=1 Tax=Roseibacillus persicicus TaxID=454148 RepID=UPI0028101C5D|nr:hypothetical protein [Roseibacillus persicicus]MDQ8192655.1 hypothetical protein [Roseibacillus persicicus]